MSKNQMDKMAQNILARRKNANYRADDSEPAVPTAVAQHKEGTAKILARRGIKAEAKEIADAPADDFGGIGGDEHVNDEHEDAEVPGAVVPAPMQYHDMAKKDLRIECDKLGIEYKKKDTNEKLIDKLTGV